MKIQQRVRDSGYLVQQELQDLNELDQRLSDQRESQA